MVRRRFLPLFRHFQCRVARVSSSPLGSRFVLPSAARVSTRNEFETLTEVDSRLTSRRSNYRIFIRPHSLPRRLKRCSLLYELKRALSRGRCSEPAGINASQDLVGRFLRRPECRAKNYSATIITAPAVIAFPDPGTRKSFRTLI